MWRGFSVRQASKTAAPRTFACEKSPLPGDGLRRPTLKLYVPEVVPVSKDRAGVIRALAGMRPLVTHRYLEE